MKKTYEWMGTRGEIVGVRTFEKSGELVELEVALAERLIAEGFPMREHEPAVPAKEK